MEYDEKVLECFLKDQCKLFPEPVAETAAEAADFLEDVCAVVCKDRKEVLDYLEEAGVDTEGLSPAQLLQIEEVFEVGDGRYLVVEC